MDKENLYYVVRKDTNARIFNNDGEIFFNCRTPMIGSKEASELWIKDLNVTGEYEIMSIKEYESKFCDELISERQ